MELVSIFLRIRLKIARKGFLTKKKLDSLYSQNAIDQDILFSFNKNTPTQIICIYRDYLKVTA